MQALSSEVSCKVDDPEKAALATDCAAAIASGAMHPVVGLMQGKKGGQWWASVSLHHHLSTKLPSNIFLVRPLLRSANRVRTGLAQGLSRWSS